MTQTQPMLELLLDVRPLRKTERHPAIFRRYDSLAVGEHFVLINSHDPKHLRDEFDVEFPGGYRWDYLERGPGLWRIQIGKAAATALPRVLGDTNTITTDSDPGAAGAIWKLQMSSRDLDSNIIALPAGGGIDAHTGPDLDVLLHVLSGSGTLTTELGDIELAAGAIVWLPRRSRRQFLAGPDGLSYLSVHQRRQSLGLLGPS